MPKEDRFNKVYASEGQIRGLNDDVRSLENMLAQDRARGDRRKIQDEGLVLDEIRQKKELIEQHSPHKLKGQQANKANAEAKQLAKELQEAMPSGRAYRQPYPTSKSGHKKEREFEDTVRQQVEFQRNKKLKAKQTRYKAIMSQLDPSDPNVRNLEELRK